jgi:hypothetical protein
MGLASVSHAIHGRLFSSSNQTPWRMKDLIIRVRLVSLLRRTGLRAPDGKHLLLSSYEST